MLAEVNQSREYISATKRCELSSSENKLTHSKVLDQLSRKRFEESFDTTTPCTENLYFVKFERFAKDTRQFWQNKANGGQRQCVCFSDEEILFVIILVVTENRLFQ